MEIVSWKEGRSKNYRHFGFYDEFIQSKYKNYLVIMDNDVIHKSKLIKEKIEYDNNNLLYSVPYHPETNSIE